MQKYNPDFTMEQLEGKITHFLFNEIKAKFYYLSTLLVRANPKKPALNIFKRYVEQVKPIKPPQKEFNFFKQDDLYREYYAS